LCFPLRGLLFGFWVVNVKSSFISCYDLRGEVLDISYFTRHLVAHRQMLLLLFVSEQPRCKPGVHVLP
jgi:hypothetical protein